MKFAFYLTAVLVILKLFPGITSSWWGVVSPLLVFTAIALILIIFSGLPKRDAK